MCVRYLGSYIKYDESKIEIFKVIAMSNKYPQEIYATVAYEIQPEWIFLQRVTKNTGHAFEGLEKVLREKFCLVFSLEDRRPSLQF